MRFVHRGETYELVFKHLIDDVPFEDLQRFDSRGLVGEDTGIEFVNKVQAKRARGVTMCAVLKNGNTLPVVGVAVCGGTDQYNKELGRQIALAHMQELLLVNKLASSKVVTKIGLAYFCRENSRMPQVTGPFGSRDGLKAGDVLSAKEQAEVADAWGYMTEEGRDKYRP